MTQCELQITSSCTSGRLRVGEGLEGWGRENWTAVNLEDLRSPWELSPVPRYSDSPQEEPSETTGAAGCQASGGGVCVSAVPTGFHIMNIVP